MAAHLIDDREALSSDAISY